MESTEDYSRQIIWEYHQQHFEFWENGRVNIPQNQEHKVCSDWINCCISICYHSRW